MKHTLVIFRRELSGYFSTPVAYVFAVVFLFLAGIFTFYFGRLYENDQATLAPFFSFLPWLFLFLVPAISMRLWSEERKSGTIELLLTLPVSMSQAVCGKFMAAWCFTAIVLSLTLPTWLTVNYLGNPDNGVIVAGYVGAFLLAGSYLAIGSFISALTRNQVIAFVVTVVVCFLFLVIGFPPLLDWISAWAPSFVLDTVASFSFLTHVESISRGVIDVRDLLYFASLIVCFLVACAVMVDVEKAG